MLKKITLITISRNRHPYLERIIDYYANSAIQVLIADDSKEKYSKVLPPNTAYYQYSGVPYLFRFDDIIQKVKTPYVVFCADDDFIVPEGISKCVSFLDTNPDYNSAHGQYVFFYHSKNKLFYTPGYLVTVGCDINEDTAMGRTERYKKLPIQLCYCVHRTENLKLTFNTLKNSVNNLGLFETIIGMKTLIEGKHKVLPVFYSARQSLYSSAGSGASIDVCASKDEYKNEYNSYLVEMASLLSKKDNIPFDEAFAFFKQLMVEFVDYRYISKPSSKKMMMKFIKKTIPFGLRKGARHYLLLLQEQNKKKNNIQLSQKINSFPFITGSPENKELQKIENCILKYNVK